MDFNNIYYIYGFVIVRTSAFEFGNMVLPALTFLLSSTTIIFNILQFDFENSFSVNYWPRLYALFGPILLHKMV